MFFRKHVLLFTIILTLCYSSHALASPMLEHSDTNLFFQLEKDFTSAIQTKPQPKPSPSEPTPLTPPEVTIPPEALIDYVDALLVDKPMLLIDPFISPLVIKGCLAFAGICYMWYSTSYIMNTYDETLESGNEWIYQKWDEISQYFQDLPVKTQATFTKMMGKFSDQQLKEAYPDITPTELAQISLPETSYSFSFFERMAGFKESMRALIMGHLDAKLPATSLPANQINFYRILNVNHAYGHGVKIPSSINEFFPTNQPYGVSYRATLEKYNYGWEYINMDVYYHIPKISATTDTLVLKLTYVSRLSPNQQYDGLVYPTIDWGKQGLGIKVTLYDDNTTYLDSTVYGQYTNSSMINPGIPNQVRSIVQNACGFTPSVDDTLWHSWIDICPLPENIYLTVGSSRPRKVYQKNGFEFPVEIVAPTEIYPSEIARIRLPSGAVPSPLEREELILKSLPHLNDPTIPLKPPPDITPLPNPIDKPLPPEPPIEPPLNPDVPKGFFDFIINWMNKVWGWLKDFFSTLWTGFMDAMKTLFIPSDDFFTNSFDSLKDEIGAAFGYINWQQFETSLTGVNAQKPDFSVIIYGQKVNLIDLRFWDEYRPIIQGLIIAVVGFLLFLYNLRMVQWIIRSSDQYHQSSNVHDATRTTKGGRFL